MSKVIIHIYIHTYICVYKEDYASWPPILDPKGSWITAGDGDRGTRTGKIWATI